MGKADTPEPPHAAGRIGARVRKSLPACLVAAAIAGGFGNEKQLGFHLTLSKERIAKKRLTYLLWWPGAPFPSPCRAGWPECSELLTSAGKLWLPESCPDRPCVPAIKAALLLTGCGRRRFAKGFVSDEHLSRQNHPDHLGRH